MTKLLCLCNNLERNTKSRQLINTLLIVSSENICMIEPARTNRRKLMCKNPAATCARTQGDRSPRENVLYREEAWRAALRTGREAQRRLRAASGFFIRTEDGAENCGHS